MHIIIIAMVAVSLSCAVAAGHCIKLYAVQRQRELVLADKENDKW